MTTQDSAKILQAIADFSTKLDDLSTKIDELHIKLFWNVDFKALKEAEARLDAGEGLTLEELIEGLPSGGATRNADP